MDAPEDVEGLPPLEELLNFLRLRGGRASVRDVARAFRLSRPQRIALRRLLARLRRQGVLPRRTERHRAAAWPRMTVVEVVALERDGGVLVETPLRPGERIRLRDPRGGVPPLAPGDRALVRLDQTESGEVEAELVRTVPRPIREAVGVVESSPAGLWLRPAGRKGGRSFRLRPGKVQVEAGDLVRARLVLSRPLAPPEAVVVERFGRADDSRTITPAVAAQYGFALAFPRPLLARAARLGAADREGRLDLTDLPLVTIDGEDARDFDDAVAAERLGERGYRLWVAIADVAHYVRPEDVLDEEARRRGNSVYFPDRALPMLPPALSERLCSLQPGEERPCVVVELEIDRAGRTKQARFHRAVMRSRARLTYERVQAARDGRPDAECERWWEPVLEPLFAVYEALHRARRRRGCLEITLPERKVVFDEDGDAVDLRLVPPLESHRLIEECMIAANVAVATRLAERKVPILYRVHDRPDAAKLEQLADYLQQIGVPWSRTAKKASDFTRLLERLVGHPLYASVADLVLRCQAQAVYQPHNIGHFGLNLKTYCHFTSPIRRYADLEVHRALIASLDLGPGGRSRPLETERLEELGRHLSARERMAMEAEREAINRFAAAVLRRRLGEVFRGRITGVHAFGLFVALEDNGAEGLVPLGELGAAARFDPRRQRLEGRRGSGFALGDRVAVQLIEADPVRGTLAFRIVEQGEGVPRSRERPVRSRGQRRMRRR